MLLLIDNDSQSKSRDSDSIDNRFQLTAAKNIKI